MISNLYPKTLLCICIFTYSPFISCDLCGYLTATSGNLRPFSLLLSSPRFFCLYSKFHESHQVLYHSNKVKMLIQNVKNFVLKWPKTTRVLTNVLFLYSLQVLSCLATLLRKQDLSVWSYPSTLQVYHGLLVFTVHSKPKVCLFDSNLVSAGMLLLI